MKRKLWTLVFSLWVLESYVGARAQGTFQNLNFESVNITPPSQREFFPFGDVFPGWAGYIGATQANLAFYNGVSLGAALNSIIGPYTPYDSNSVISGKFTAVLAAGVINPGPNSSLESVALAQRSMIPVSAQSLRFKLGQYSYVGDLEVAFGGQIIPFFPLTSGSNFTVYGGDISAFAGATGELRFTERPISWPFAKAYLDDIEFSPNPIPEPSGLLLWLLSSALLSLAYLRHRNRQCACLRSRTRVTLAAVRRGWNYPHELRAELPPQPMLHVE